MAVVAPPPTLPSQRTPAPTPVVVQAAKPVMAAAPPAVAAPSPARAPAAGRPPLSPTSTSSSSVSSSSPPKNEWPEGSASPTRAASKGLAPLETPAYVLPQFVRDEQTIIVLKDSATMFDKRQCDVRDAHGIIILTVKDHLASLVNQKDIIDPGCNVVYSVKNKRTSVKRTYEVVDPSGTVLFEVRHTPTEKDKMSCVFKDANSGKESRIVLRGKFHTGRGDLILLDGSNDQGVSVAEVRHTVAGPNDVVKDPSTYFITVAAGVDLGLIATTALCFDRMPQE